MTCLLQGATGSLLPAPSTASYSTGLLPFITSANPDEISLDDDGTGNNDADTKASAGALAKHAANPDEIDLADDDDVDYCGEDEDEDASDADVIAPTGDTSENVTNEPTQQGNTIEVFAVF